jgi:hypothetical protein
VGKIDRVSDWDKGPNESMLRLALNLNYQISAACVRGRYWLCTQLNIEIKINSRKDMMERFTKPEKIVILLED